MRTMSTASVVLLANLILPIGELQANDESPSIETRVQEVYRRVSPAVVRVEVGQIGWGGVIVTAEGHVLTFRHSNPGAELPIHLTDGRRATAQALGWSEEFSVGLLKIKDKGPWPYVEMAPTADVEVGDMCLALGFPIRLDLRFDDRPALRFGHVTQLFLPFWLSVSCGTSLSEVGTGVFDKKGRLLGITAPSNGGSPTTLVCIDLIKDNWDGLAAGKNLDWVRYPPAQSSLYHQLNEGKDLDQLGPKLNSELVDQPKSSPIEPSSKHDFDAAMKKAKEASVRIRSNERLSFDQQSAERWSGTIISEDGYILTCAHTDQVPGEKVTVVLPDGREVAAVVQGTNRITDVGLVKITQPGRWPHAEMGLSADLWFDDPVVIVGYPARRPSGQPNDSKTPVVATTKIAKTRYIVWGSFLLTRNDYQISGGMSGGGVFDSNGRIVAVHTGAGGPRIECVRKQWNDLKSARRPSIASNEASNKFRQNVLAEFQLGTPPVVEVLVKGKRRALGTIIDTDGKILTKASELYGAVTCRLADGSVVPARVVGKSRRHDLALLQVEAMNLADAEFNSADPVEGQLLAALIPGEPPRVGVVSGVKRELRPEPSWSAEGVRQTDRGLEVQGVPTLLTFTAEGPKPVQGLKNGDIVVEIEGHPTPNLDDLTDYLESKLQSPHRFAGDPIQATVMRRGRKMKIYFPLPAKPGRPTHEMFHSPRRAGFPDVFDTDIALTRELCGGPIVDRTGRIIGISIASRGKDHEVRWPTHVIPAAVARVVARELAARKSDK